MDTLFGAPSAKVPDAKIEQSAAAQNLATDAAQREVIQEAHCQEINQEFVKNGSRDKYGYLRANIGGRPKKVVAAHTPDKKKQCANRKKVGGAGKREFSAQEKLAL